MPSSEITFSVVVGYKRRNGIQETTGAKLKINDKVGGANGTYFHATLTGSTSQIAAATALIRDAEDRHRLWAERRKAERENFRANSPATTIANTIQTIIPKMKPYHQNMFHALSNLDGDFPELPKTQPKTLPTDERGLEAAELGFTMEQLEAAEALEEMDFQEEVQLELIAQDYREELTTADEFNPDPTHISDGNAGEFIPASELKPNKRERQARNKATKGKPLNFADCFRQEYVPTAPKRVVIGRWADYA